MPADDVGAAARHYVDELGTELVWKVRGMGTGRRVPARLVGWPGDPAQRAPRGPAPILVYRMADHAAARNRLRAAGLELHELEIPHGPCASFVAPGGQPLAIYELTRPHVAHHLDGRIDG